MIGLVYGRGGDLALFSLRSIEYYIVLYVR